MATCLCIIITIARTFVGHAISKWVQRVCAASIAIANCIQVEWCGIVDCCCERLARTQYLAIGTAASDTEFFSFRRPLNEHRPWSVRGNVPARRVCSMRLCAMSSVCAAYANGINKLVLLMPKDEETCQIEWVKLAIFSSTRTHTRKWIFYCESFSQHFYHSTSTHFSNGPWAWVEGVVRLDRPAWTRACNRVSCAKTAALVWLLPVS